MKEVSAAVQSQLLCRCSVWALKLFSFVERKKTWFCYCLTGIISSNNKSFT